MTFYDQLMPKTRKFQTVPILFPATVVVGTSFCSKFYNFDSIFSWVMVRIRLKLGNAMSVSVLTTTERQEFECVNPSTKWMLGCWGTDGFISNERSLPHYLKLRYKYFVTLHSPHHYLESCLIEVNVVVVICRWTREHIS